MEYLQVIPEIVSLLGAALGAVRWLKARLQPEQRLFEAQPLGGVTVQVVFQ